MMELNRDWIGKQLGKIVAAYEGVLKTERDHRDHVDVPALKELYADIVSRDDANLHDIRGVAAKYGYEGGGGVMETIGGIAGGAKSLVEGALAMDEFQMLADDIIVKASPLNSGKTWDRIFRELGDAESADVMRRVAADNEDHTRQMLDACVVVGLVEARGAQSKAA